MSDISWEKKWPELYKEALLEPDYSRLPDLIDDAERAIQRRAMEIWYGGALESKELQDLDSALRFLELLRLATLNEDIQYARAEN